MVKMSIDYRDLGKSAPLNRRTFSLFALGVGLMPSVVMAAGEPAAPTLEFVFEATVTLGTPLELGSSAAARSRFVPITGGTIAGPKLNGVVLAGGGVLVEIRDRCTCPPISEARAAAARNEAAAAGGNF